MRERGERAEKERREGVKESGFNDVLIDFSSSSGSSGTLKHVYLHLLTYFIAKCSLK